MASNATTPTAQKTASSPSVSLSERVSKALETWNTAADSICRPLKTEARIGGSAEGDGGPMGWRAVHSILAGAGAGARML